MATTKEREKLRQEVEALLEELSAVDATSLGRRSELSPDINFEDIVLEFQAMLDVVRQLHDRDLSRMPHQELQNVKKGLANLQTHIQQVRDFTLTQENPASVRDSLRDKVRGIYDSVVQPMMLTLAFTATQATDYARIEREAQGFHTRVKEEAAEFEKTLARQKDMAESAMAAIRQQAAQAGVSGNAQNYSDQANTYQKNAKKWFGATVAVASVTLLAAIIFLISAFMYTPAGTAEAIQHIVAKVIVLSVLSFAIFWCARNYGAEKHNETNAINLSHNSAPSRALRSAGA